MSNESQQSDPMDASHPCHRFVSTAWGLSRRPRLYTPTGAVAEVVAYLAGMADLMGPTVGDRARMDVMARLADWLAARHGIDEPEALSSAARICGVLTKRFADPVEGMWREVEVFADEVLGVPKGTYPLRLGPCGYGGMAGSGEDR